MDPLRAVRPAYLILSNKSILLLARAHPLTFSEGGEDQIRKLAIEASGQWKRGWAGEVLEVIRQFDEEVQSLKETKLKKDQEDRKRRKLEEVERKKLEVRQQWERAHELAQKKARENLENMLRTQPAGTAHTPALAARPNEIPQTVLSIRTGRYNTGQKALSRAEGSKSAFEKEAERVKQEAMARAAERLRKMKEMNHA